MYLFKLELSPIRNLENSSACICETAKEHNPRIVAKQERYRKTLSHMDWQTVNNW